MPPSIPDPQPSIAALIARRDAWLDGGGTPLAEAEARAAATRAIAADFPAFERARDALIGRVAARGATLPPALIRVLAAAHVIAPEGHTWQPASAEAHRYLRGGWLEEYIGLAASAAGADEVRIGQVLGWRAAAYEGRNEIDAIARFGGRLVFASAKALRSRLDAGDIGHRERLMDALQEADNLVDHFGDSGSAVLLVVTTDLVDEARHAVRYAQLHGKAAALGVQLVGLEGLGWDALVARFRQTGLTAVA
jgi:hypothetical protein